MESSWSERESVIDVTNDRFGLGSVLSEALITITNQEKKNWVADWHCESS